MTLVWIKLYFLISPSNEKTKLSNEALAQLCEMIKIYTLEVRGTRAIKSINSTSVVDPNQCCGAAIFLGGSCTGCGSPRSRSRLRLQPNWVGSDIGSGSRKKGRLQKKRAAPGGSGSRH